MPFRLTKFEKSLLGFNTLPEEMQRDIRAKALKPTLKDWRYWIPIALVVLGTVVVMVMTEPYISDAVKVPGTPNFRRLLIYAICGGLAGLIASVIASICAERLSRKHYEILVQSHCVRCGSDISSPAHQPAESEEQSR